MKSTGLLLGACLWVTPDLRAEIIARDGFETYPLGTLAGQSGGTGWAGPWELPAGGNPQAEVIDTTAVPMTYEVPEGTLVSGATRALQVQLTGAATSQISARRELSVPLTRTFYAAYLVRHEGGESWAAANNTFTLHLGTNASGTASLNFGLRGNTSAGSDEFVVRYGTGGPVAGASAGGQVLTGTNYYLVARLNWTGDAFTSANLWVNPGADSETAKPSGDAQLQGFSCSAVTHVFWREAVLDSDDILRADELALATAWADVVPAGPSNPRPVVSLTEPAAGAVFDWPGAVLLRAAAMDGNGVVTNVSFYAGETKLADDSVEPYEFLWTNATSGSHTLTALATDDQGATGVSPAVLISVLGTNRAGVINGELKKWHRVTITWEGPQASETDLNNPFRNYRLNVTFTHPESGRTYVVPGYFAADGDAANTSAVSGNKWRVDFAPDEAGTWQYVASFRAGTDVALSTEPAAGIRSDFDGASGSFVVALTDKAGRDLRGKGRLQYVGKHHLCFAETGDFFLKMGADSPENLLNYEDFDGQPAGASYRKSWSAHAADYDADEAEEHTWKNGQGKNLLGAIRYLSDQGLAAFSFIPFTIGGDDKNVCPHLLKGTAANPSWSSGVHHDRFDVSRMEQWDRIFAYGDRKGMFLHFKLMETENELLMDGGNLGPERILYFREMIARFGYHLALNWNLGEEIDAATTQQKQSWSQYFYDNDPYRHPQVIHNGADHYDLLGTRSHLTGFSLQAGPGSEGVFHKTLDYLARSAAAGVPWVVANDEQGDANTGVVPDANDYWHDGIRGPLLWSHVLAGGAGAEFYFGYAYPQSDLTGQDFRSRENWWRQCRHLLEFFHGNEIPFQNMTNRDKLLTGMSGTHCLALPGRVYVGRLPSPGVVSIDLGAANGEFRVAWFDPRHGGAMQKGSIDIVSGGGVRSLGTPPGSSTNDWVFLVRSSPIVPPTLNGSLTSEGLQLQWNAPGSFLQQATHANGSWMDIEPSPVSPYLAPATNAARFFRLRLPL